MNVSLFTLIASRPPRQAGHAHSLQRLQATGRRHPDVLTRVAAAR